MTEGRRARVAVVAPFPELVRECEAAFREAGIRVPVEVGDLEEGVRAARRAVENGAEAIVSRGGTALRISRALSVPVVEIQVSPYDILRCLRRLRNHRGLIGITGFRNVVCGCEILGDLLGMRIRQIVVESEEDALEKVTEAARDGVDMIIGDAVSVKLASKLGIGGMLVASGKEAVAKAIVEAEKIAEVRVRERERSELLRVMVEHSPDGIVAIDRNGRVTLFNPAAERIFGIGAAEAVGASFDREAWADGSSGGSLLRDHVHPEDVPPTLRAVADLGGGAEGVFLTNRVRLPGGGYRWIDWQGAPLGNGAFLVTARDVTRKRMEAEEQAALKDRLFQSQKLETVGLLAGGVAHDFNNLLTPVLGYSELLMRGFPEGSPDRRKLEQIHQAADQARVLTTRLLAFGRRQTLRLEAVDVAEVVRGLEPVIRRTIREDIRVRIAADGGTGRARADRGQVEQALLNLAVNAQEAMPDGGTLIIETANVHLDESYASAHAEVVPGPYVMVSVTDTGTGMDEETRARVFEPFYAKKGGGGGLGLPTVYGIVKQHGGAVNVYSEPGRGSVFKIYLPRVPEGEEGPAPRAVAPVAAGGPPEGGNETVLVAEDNESVREMTCMMLEGLGYRVLSGESAERCLEIAAAFDGPIHLLLTDVIMPGRNGKELYDLLAAARPGMKVLFMSGYSANVIGHHGILEEGVDFLQKPFRRADLSRKVREALGK
jgi:PAS domain S-box-containing protein